MVTTAILNYLKEIFTSYYANDSYVAAVVTITSISQDKTEITRSSTKNRQEHFLKVAGDFRSAHASQQRLDLVFRAEGAAAFGRMFTNPQGTAVCYRFWYRNIQEVFAPRMPTIRPYFAENSQPNRPYFAEENRPFTQGPPEMSRSERP